jgi:DNA repair protein RecN (Recombination protein N)
MQAAEKMRADVARAAAALSPEGAEGQMGDARRWLDGLTDRADGGLDGALAALERAMVELGEAQSEVAGFAEAGLQPRRAGGDGGTPLRAARAWRESTGSSPDDLERFGAELEARVAALDGGADGDRGAARGAQGRRGSLARRRRPAEPCAGGGGGRLDAAMAGELAPLKLERAVFSTVLAPADPGPTGADAVTFTVATNPGAPRGR